MKWSAPDEDGFRWYRPEAHERAIIHTFADKLDSAGFIKWLAEQPIEARRAHVCLLLAYGCEYNAINEPVQSFSKAVRPLVEHMTTVPGRIGVNIGLDQRFALNYLSTLSESEFAEVAIWAFLFYARNDNWRKFV